MNGLVTTTINNIFHGIWFTAIVIEPKYDRKKTIWIVSGTTIFFEIIMISLRFLRLSEILHYTPDSAIAVSYLIGYLLAVVVFGGMYIFGISASHPAKSLFLISAYFSLWTLIYITISFLTGTFSGAGTFAIWALRIGLNLFFLILYLRFFKQRLYRIIKEVKSGYGIVSTISVTAFSVMTLLIVYNEKMKKRDAFFVIVVFLICIFIAAVYVLMLQFIEQSAQVYHMKQIQFHEKFLTAQIDVYKEMEQNARQTRHDFRHHNMVVIEYAKKKDYEGILSYLNEYEERENKKYTQSFCSNQAVNNVLCAYADKAAQNGITAKTDIRLPDMEGISDYDLVSILANILENAINACMKSDNKRELELMIKQKGSKLFISCENTCTTDVLFENGLPKNEASDSIGIASILTSVEKYNGDADFSVSNGTFTCRVILNTQKAI